MLILILIFILTSLWYTWLFVNYLKKPKHRLPPGPRGLPIVGNLPFLNPQLHSYFAGLAHIYGPILTVTLGTKAAVVITSPDIAREVLKDHDIIFANRDIPAVSSAMEYGQHDLVFSPYGSQWRMLRKICVHHLIGPASLDVFYSYRRQEIRNTIRYLYSMKASPVNVGEQMFLNMLNVVTSMLWGGTIEGAERASVGAEFRLVVDKITQLLGRPNLSDFFPGLAWLDLQGMRRQMKEEIQKLDHIFGEIIQKRIKIDQGADNNGAIGRKDFLQVLLQLKDAGDAKTPLTMSHVKALLVNMVVGGTDTTSSAVEFAMAEMLNKPEIMIKAQQELDTVVGKANAVEESHLDKLPYLQAIMKEVLRLHPSLPLMVPHAPSESCNVGGYMIPKGARIFVNVWAIQRDPTIWENPTEFVPERFLNGRGDYSGKDFSYIPFGSGRRICAGMAMAERMVMFPLASLLHSFDWSLPEGEKLDLSEQFGIVMKKKIPLVAIPTPRLSESAVYD